MTPIFLKNGGPLKTFCIIYSHAEPIESGKPNEEETNGVQGPLNMDHFVEKTTQEIQDMIKNLQKLK